MARATFFVQNQKLNCYFLMKENEIKNIDYKLNISIFKSIEGLSLNKEYEHLDNHFVIENLYLIFKNMLNINFNTTMLILTYTDVT